MAAKSKTRPGGIEPVAVITGASEGLGLALAVEFAKAGHGVLLVARNQAKLAAAADALARYGREVHYTAQDLATPQGPAAVEAYLRAHGLHAEYLVNNAGLGSGGFFQDDDRERLLTMIDLNVRGLVDLTRRLFVGMLARGRGGVLNVGSMTGFMPTPYEATYAATKAFVLSFSRALAYEAMWTGVTVSALMAGVIATRWHEKAGASHSRYLYLLPVMTPERMARSAYRAFMRRKKIIVPGLFNKLLVLLVNFTPYFVLMACMGFLFRVLDEKGYALPPGPLPDPEETLPAAEDDPPRAPEAKAGR
jgi:uncharacterized protein